jgi:TonB family protein
MPLNVRRLGTSLSLVLLFVVAILAQNPTTTDVMRARISKAKAFVAIKNYAAAIYELEGIKRETNDATVTSVAQVMLIGCYLEQLDYKRAQSLLTEIFNAQKANKPGSNYFVVAGQVVKSARSQLDRYKSLGLSVADRNLPVEAVADVEKMRETVEMVVTHSKTLGENKKLTSDSMALLEEAGNARSGLARDDYDAKRWKDAVADAREQLSASRTTIINAVDDGPTNTIDANKMLATNSTPTYSMTPEPTAAQTTPKTTETGFTQPKTQNPPVTEKKETFTKTEAPQVSPEMVAKNEPVVEQKPENKEAIKDPSQNNPARDRLVGKKDNTVTESLAANNTPIEEKKVENQPAPSEPVKDPSPLQVGSLIDYATAKVAPTYPPAAKTMRMTGTVKVEVIISEDGSIAEVKNTSGPSMLQRAATDALKKWKFKPFIKDGQPVKATGFVSFNFSL